MWPSVTLAWHLRDQSRSSHNTSTAETRIVYIRRLSLVGWLWLQQLNNTKPSVKTSGRVEPRKLYVLSVYSIVRERRHKKRWPTSRMQSCLHWHMVPWLSNLFKTMRTMLKLTSNLRRWGITLAHAWLRISSPRAQLDVVPISRRLVKSSQKWACSQSSNQDFLFNEDTSWAGWFQSLLEYHTYCYAFCPPSSVTFAD